MVHPRVYFALVKSKLYCLIKIECMMNNLVSIAIFSVGFFGLCVLTQSVVDYLSSIVCRLFDLKEEMSNEF